MFLSFRLKPVIAFIAILIIGSTMSFTLVVLSKKANADTRFRYTIVLDAGHGGDDGGCVGAVTGVKERDLNLKVTKKLEAYLVNFGFHVVLTRKDNGGLYDKNASNQKLSDMNARKSIIEKVGADLVVSIHMNSFADKSQTGAQAFYTKGDETAKQIADCIQTQFAVGLPNGRENSNFGDYYVLQCTSVPSVMVECGFLSNAEEEKLLITEEYQDKLAYNIFCGLLRYFEITETFGESLFGKTNIM